MNAPINNEPIYWAWKCEKCGRWCAAINEDFCICGHFKPRPNYKTPEIQKQPQLPTFRDAFPMPKSFPRYDSGPIGSTLANRNIFGGYDVPPGRDSLTSKDFPQRSAVIVTPPNPLRISSLLNEEDTTSGYNAPTIKDRRFDQYAIVSEFTTPSGASTTSEPGRSIDTAFQNNSIQYDTTSETNDASSARFTALNQRKSYQGNSEASWPTSTKENGY
ncbi:uncharacterized protein F4817DRAFT_320385 [Daldinia loculata]|uniref:uncharacterized protein n=1 Tax=Daldinia loculata TaxID=103429 RepID=UPI0020C26CA0|nr:uncharacterized protein F4817DRAFT_320385 [Daldinia loculata]KAI1642813.1 hypothetical protein F4817DRAFT_320385 [Daldinia loculata]